MQLAAVRIFVLSVREALTFYEDTLGLELVYDGSDSGYLRFISANVQIMIEETSSTATPEELSLVGRFLGLSFAVDNAQVEYERLRAAGVRFLGRPELQAWGGVIATLEDPSRNRLQIVQYPSFV